MHFGRGPCGDSRAIGALGSLQKKATRSIDRVPTLGSEVRLRGFLVGYGAAEGGSMIEGDL